jgi:hypothetical protein
MMSQGMVPNTYAAGRATLAIASRRRAPQPDLVDQIADADAALCECGRRRLHTKPACTRCTMLDAGTDTAALDAGVIKLFEVGDALPMKELIERYSYKYQRSVLSGALRRLVEAGQLTRRPGAARRDGVIYTRVA